MPGRPRRLAPGAALYTDLSTSLKRQNISHPIQYEPIPERIPERNLPRKPRTVAGRHPADLERPEFLHRTPHPTLIGIHQVHPPHHAGEPPAAREYRCTPKRIHRTGVCAA